MEEDEGFVCLSYRLKLSYMNQGACICHLLEVNLITLSFYELIGERCARSPACLVCHKVHFRFRCRLVRLFLNSKKKCMWCDANNLES